MDRRNRRDGRGNNIFRQLLQQRMEQIMSRQGGGGNRGGGRPDDFIMQARNNKIRGSSGGGIGQQAIGQVMSGNPNLSGLSGAYGTGTTKVRGNGRAYASAEPGSVDIGHVSSDTPPVITINGKLYTPEGGGVSAPPPRQTGVYNPPSNFPPQGQGVGRTTTPTGSQVDPTKYPSTAPQGQGVLGTSAVTAGANRGPMRQTTPPVQVGEQIPSQVGGGSPSSVAPMQSFQQGAAPTTNPKDLNLSTPQAGGSPLGNRIADVVKRSLGQNVDQGIPTAGGIRDMVNQRLMDRGLIPDDPGNPFINQPIAPPKKLPPLQPGFNTGPIKPLPPEPTATGTTPATTPAPTGAGPTPNAGLPVIQGPTQLPGSAVTGQGSATPNTVGSPVGVIDDASMQLGNAVGVDWQTLNQWDPIINEAAAKYGVDPAIIKAAIAMESAGNPDAKNPASSSAGLLQIQPEWHAESAAALGYDLNTPEGQVGYFAALIAGQVPGQDVRGNTPLERYINNYQGPEAGQTDPNYTAAYQHDVETLVNIMHGSQPAEAAVPGLDPGVAPLVGPDGQPLPVIQGPQQLGLTQPPGKVGQAATATAPPPMDTTYTGSLDAATNCFECPDNPSSFQPEFIVYHMTDGESFGGAASFDQDGDGTPDGSTNYIIDKDGTIYELVPPGSAMPWANGQTEGAGVITKEQLRAAAEADNLNNRSISIEMVGISGQPLTPEQIAAGQALTGHLSGQYGIPMDDQHLVGHNDITPGTRSDPVGSYDPMDMVPVQSGLEVPPGKVTQSVTNTATVVAPPGSKPGSSGLAGTTDPVGMQIADIADDYVGSPYVSAGTDPSGWDCSGFTYYVAQKAGITDFPQGSHEQYNWAVENGKMINDPNQLQPGDVIFLDTGYSVRGGNNASHTAIYLGDGKIIQALNENDGTVISDLSDFLEMYPFLGAARL